MGNSLLGIKYHWIFSLKHYHIVLLLHIILALRFITEPILFYQQVIKCVINYFILFNISTFIKYKNVL